MEGQTKKVRLKCGFNHFEYSSLKNIQSQASNYQLLIQSLKTNVEAKMIMAKLMLDAKR